MTISRRKKTFQSKTVEPLPLLDTQEPNLYRSIFPYDEVCRVEFDNKFVFIDPPEEIFITDTTFRDGQQARPPYTVEQIVDLFDMIHKLGGSRNSSSTVRRIRRPSRNVWRETIAIPRSPDGSVPSRRISGW
jgi:hypothetical protein